MEFEWDEAKRQNNLAKHGVDFADAVGALLDNDNRTIEDTDTKGEHRYITLGCGFCDRVLLVVWTERLSGDAIKIISARTASRSERQ